MTTAFLVVRAGRRRVGLPLESVVEVGELGAVQPVPAGHPAVRGVTPYRDRLLPVVHLGALLEGDACPADPAGTAVLVTLGAGRVALEVEEAELVVREPVLPVPGDARLPWASAVARRPEGLVPLLDLGSLGARLQQTGSEP